MIKETCSSTEQEHFQLQFEFLCIELAKNNIPAHLKVNQSFNLSYLYMVVSSLKGQYFLTVVGFP